MASKLGFEEMLPALFFKIRLETCVILRPFGRTRGEGEVLAVEPTSLLAPREKLDDLSAGPVPLMFLKCCFGF